MVLRILIFLHLNLGHVHTNPEIYETAQIGLLSTRNH